MPSARTLGQQSSASVARSVRGQRGRRIRKPHRARDYTNPFGRNWLPILGAQHDARLTFVHGDDADAGIRTGTQCAAKRSLSNRKPEGSDIARDSTVRSQSASACRVGHATEPAPADLPFAFRPSTRVKGVRIGVGQALRCSAAAAISRPFPYDRRLCSSSVSPFLCVKPFPSSPPLALTSGFRSQPLCSMC